MDRVHTNGFTNQEYSDNITSTWNKNASPIPKLEWEDEDASTRRIRFNPRDKVKTFEVDTEMSHTPSVPRIRDANARRKLDHFDMSQEDVRSAIDTTHAKILVIAKDMSGVSHLDMSDDRLRLQVNMLTHQLTRLTNLVAKLPEHERGYWEAIVLQLSEFCAIFSDDSIGGGGVWPIYSICLIAASFAIAMIPR
jgi:hypothetical protein